MVRDQYKVKSTNTAAAITEKWPTRTATAARLGEEPSPNASPRIAFVGLPCLTRTTRSIEIRTTRDGSDTAG
jgi:hypothetical protein